MVLVVGGGAGGTDTVDRGLVQAQNKALVHVVVLVVFGMLVHT